jgi:hypothetical protein
MRSLTESWTEITGLLKVNSLEGSRAPGNPQYGGEKMDYRAVPGKSSSSSSSSAKFEANSMMVRVRAGVKIHFILTSH